MAVTGTLSYSNRRLTDWHCIHNQQLFGQNINDKLATREFIVDHGKACSDLMQSAAETQWALQKLETFLIFANTNVYLSYAVVELQ